MSVKNKWTDLISSLKEVLLDLNGSISRLSILNFNSSVKLENEFCRLDQIKPDYFDHFKIGTEFDLAFRATNNLIQKYMHKSNIKIIFMTDGESTFPELEINELIQLKITSLSKFGKSIKFFAIPFRCGSSILEQICKKIGDGEVLSAKRCSSLVDRYGCILNDIN